MVDKSGSNEGNIRTPTRKPRHSSTNWHDDHSGADHDSGWTRRRKSSSAMLSNLHSPAVKLYDRCRTPRTNLFILVARPDQRVPPRSWNAICRSQLHHSNVPCLATCYLAWVWYWVNGGITTRYCSEIHNVTPNGKQRAIKGYWSNPLLIIIHLSDSISPQRPVSLIAVSLFSSLESHTQ